MRLGGNVPVFRWIGAVNGSIVNLMELLRIAPRGMGDVHKMLFDTGGRRPCPSSACPLCARPASLLTPAPAADPLPAHPPTCLPSCCSPALPAHPPLLPAVSIMEGGIEGIFTPMHMLVFQKPENAKSTKGSPAKSPAKPAKKQ